MPEDSSEQFDSSSDSGAGEISSTQVDDSSQLPSDLPGYVPQGPLPPLPNDPADVGVPIVPPEGVEPPIDYDAPPFPSDIAVPVPPVPSTPIPLRPPEQQ